MRLHVVRAEVEGWVALIRGEPADGSESLQDCIKKATKSLFPSVAQLLRLFGTLAVSNASAERTFSKLRLMKTYLRSTMGQERLSGLALMSVHRNEIRVDPEEVMDLFQKTGNRRIRL